jgi:very-short-patch-repair endonuclease
VLGTGAVLHRLSKFEILCCTGLEARATNGFDFVPCAGAKSWPTFGCTIPLSREGEAIGRRNKNGLQITVERINNRPELKAKRRTLRQNPTRAEHVLWQAIRMEQCGVKFRRQFSVRRYILDFYCHELKLTIEADGYTHDSPYAKVKDRVRQKDLEEYGIRFLRLRMKIILSNVDKVVMRIKKEIESLRKPTPSRPSP